MRRLKLKLKRCSLWRFYSTKQLQKSAQINAEHSKFRKIRSYITRMNFEENGHFKSTNIMMSTIYDYTELLHILTYLTREVCMISFPVRWCYRKLWMMWQINVVASDKMPLNRSLPDLRDSKCLNSRYLERLPSTSIVMAVHNEAWSI